MSENFASGGDENGSNPLPSNSSENYQDDAMDLSIKDNKDGEKKFYCPAEGCVFSKGMGKSFKKKMLVDQHFLNCHSVRRFKCPNCNKLYAIEWQLRYHIKTCGIDWICMTCNKCYKERLSLITHCKRHCHELPQNAKIKKQSKGTMGSCMSMASSAPLLVNNSNGCNISNNINNNFNNNFENNLNNNFSNNLSNDLSNNLSNFFVNNLSESFSNIGNNNVSPREINNNSLAAINPLEPVSTSLAENILANLAQSAENPIFSLEAFEALGAFGELSQQQLLQIAHDAMKISSLAGANSSEEPNENNNNNSMANLNLAMEANKKQSKM